jgi:hypothetical protein
MQEPSLITLASLPPAGSAFANKMFRLAVVGAADHYYVCQRQADGSFTWLQIDTGSFTVADTASIDMTLAAGVLSAAAIFGSTATTVAAGNHTHSTYVNAVTDTASIDLTLAGQSISAAAIFGTTAGTVADGAHTHATLYQPLDATLTALAAYNTNGILVQTAADTFAGRTLTPGTGILITNGDGVAGNPTVAIDTTVVARKTDNLSVFASTTSAQLATLLSDETGSGANVFATSPTIVTPTIASLTNMQHTHLNAAGGGVLAGYQQVLTGWQEPPGPSPSNTTSVTGLTTGQTLARYIAQTTHAITTLIVQLVVGTAGVTFTWGEVALASAPDATSGNLTLLGTAQSVTTTFNSLGAKTVTFSFAIPAGTFVYLLAGSAATTPFQLRAAPIGDEFSTGITKIASARPSTMAAPTAFTTSTNNSSDAYLYYRWS